MHNDDIAYKSLLMKKFLRQNCAVKTENSIQIFSDRKAKLLATCFPT